MWTAGMQDLPCVLLGLASGFLLASLVNQPPRPDIQSGDYVQTPRRVDSGNIHIDKAGRPSAEAATRGNLRTVPVQKHGNRSIGKWREDKATPSSTFNAKSRTPRRWYPTQWSSTWVNAGVHGSSRPDIRTDSRLLVGVMSAVKYLRTRVAAVHNAWGKSFSPHLKFYFSYPTGAQRDEVDELEKTYREEAGVNVVHLKGAPQSEYPPQRKMFLMMHSMCASVGTYQWYLRADDDVFVRREALLEWLTKLDPHTPYYIGSFGFGRQDVMERLDLRGSFCMGGPGVILSHGAMTKLCPHIYDCMGDVMTGEEDTELGRCIQKYVGIHCTQAFEFFRMFRHAYTQEYHGYPHPYMADLQMLASDRILTVHHLKEPHLMYRVAAFFQERAISKLQTTAKKIVATMEQEEEFIKKLNIKLPPVPPLAALQGTAFAKNTSNSPQAATLQFAAQKTLELRELLGGRTGRSSQVVEAALPLSATQPEDYNSDPSRFLAASVVRSSVTAFKRYAKSKSSAPHLAWWQCGQDASAFSGACNITLDYGGSRTYGHRQVDAVGGVGQPSVTLSRRVPALGRVLIIVTCASHPDTAASLLAAIKSMTPLPSATGTATVFLALCAHKETLKVTAAHKSLKATPVTIETYQRSAGSVIGDITNGYNAVATRHGDKLKPTDLVLIMHQLPQGVTFHSNFIPSCHARSSKDVIWYSVPFDSRHHRVGSQGVSACLQLGTFKSLLKVLLKTNAPRPTDLNDLRGVVSKAAASMSPKLTVQRAVDALLHV
eukprot:scpid47287/ scgid30360/ Chondroitin sulfate synthase 1; Chondroitin glucuronyltransferase 1; Chondroitin synthase 1; Glucuronosyl-N-acetylgalactosaminyl-proteoglycan 4-beta-N-acetylgalactosaminyltransferase 1; N-acetylgalactosaminyl-proteoglycan 3-beta-glucuronosyltransferase 1; N-acetylgalactosaminyltransferase 1